MGTLISLLLAGFYVGWNIGANDAGNCIGTAVGSGLLSYRRAALLVSVFAVLGAILQGGHVMETVGKNIVTTELSVTAVVIALLCSGVFVTVATLFRLPVSTSQVIVGGIAGVGLAIGADLNVGTIVSIAQVWVICPILTALIAICIYWVSKKVLERFSRESFWQRLPHALLILSACYLAFSLGANHVGTAMGPITGLGLGIPTLWISVLGGFAMASGTLTFGHRVTQTVAGGIATLDPVSAYSAQISAALAVHFFSIYGIPVSTSQAVVGAIIGVGILQGVKTVRAKKLAGIAAGWVATPTAAGLFSFALYRLVLVFTG